MQSGTATLRAIAAGTLIVEGAGPMVRPGARDSRPIDDTHVLAWRRDVGPADRSWYTRAEVEANREAFVIEGTPDALLPLPTSDVLGQKVLEALQAEPTATASAIARKLGIRKSLGLKAVKRARRALYE